MRNCLRGVKKTVPFIVPLLIFYCVSALCFAPQFAGKVLPQHDIEQYEGMVADIRAERQLHGDDPQWTGAMFGGMPAYLISVEYPSQIVKNSVGRIVELVAAPQGFIFFAMTAAWIAMLMLGMSPWVAAVPALAYGLSTYFFLIIGAGHVTKMWALVWAPLMTGGIFVAMRGRMWLGGVLTALFASLEIGANHPQITYYFLLAMAMFWVSEAVYAIRERRIPDFAKRTAVVIAAGIAALGSNFAPMWYTYKHTPETIRGGSELAREASQGGLDLEYATAWSYGIAESWNMLVPDFAGGDSTTTFESGGAVGDALAPYGLRSAARQLPAYWGGQPYTAGPTYLGAAAIFFALLGLLLVRGRDRWWIVAAMTVMILLSWGRNFMWFTELCFRWLPMYNKFRTVSMTLTVVQWAVPLLAGMALWQMWRYDADERRRLLKPLAWAAGVTAGICLLFAVAGSALFDFGQADSEEQMTAQFYYMLQASGAGEAIAQGWHEELGAETAAAMAADRADMMERDAWRSFLFVALAAAAVALFAVRRIGRATLAAAAALLVTLDLALVDMRFLPHDRFVTERRTRAVATAADAEISKDKDLGYRVYNLTVSPFNDATTSKRYRSVGGYHGAKLSRYQDIIDKYLQAGRENGRILDMLNTRYVIESDGSVTHRESALGAAWFVEETFEVPTAGEEADMLGRIDLAEVAVSSPTVKGSKHRNDTPEKVYSTEGAISLTKYRPNLLEYEYTAAEPAFAVFSEIYAGGWKAFVDGEEVPSYRVDYILRGMELPAGSHTVEWRFRAPAWIATNVVTAIFSIVILGAVLAMAVAAAIRKYGRKKDE